MDLIHKQKISNTKSACFVKVNALIYNWKLTVHCADGTWMMTHTNLTEHHAAVRVSDETEAETQDKVIADLGEHHTVYTVIATKGKTLVHVCKNYYGTSVGILESLNFFFLQNLPSLLLY